LEEMDSINWVKDPDDEYILVRLEKAGISIDHAADKLAAYIQTKTWPFRNTSLTGTLGRIRLGSKKLTSE